MIEKGIVAVLVGSAAVQALADKRVYPTELPENGRLPAVAQARTASDRKRTLSGPTGLVRAEVELTCWAATAGKAKALADAVRVALMGTRASPAAFPAKWGAFRVQAAWVEDDADDVVPPAHGEESGEKSVSLQLTVWFEEG